MDLRARAHEKLSRAELPDGAPERLWAGPGSGADCALCDRPLESTDIEYECQFPAGGERGEAGICRFHVTCYAVWQVERVRPR
jgi:hypothetical protein